MFHPVAFHNSIFINPSFVSSWNALEGSPDGKVGLIGVFVSNLINFSWLPNNAYMSLEHAFHFWLPDIPNKTVSLLSKLTFDGGGNVFAKDHINKFLCKCIKHDISDLKVLCRLFAFTFRGWIKHWFESFPAYHTFYWFQFVEEFLDSFEIYDYNQLCEEF